MFARFLSKRFRRRHPEVEQHIGDMVEATNPRGYIGACDALRVTDLRTLLKAIHVPVLIDLTAFLVIYNPTSARFVKD